MGKGRSRSPDFSSAFYLPVGAIAACVLHSRSLAFYPTRFGNGIDTAALVGACLLVQVVFRKNESLSLLIFGYICGAVGTDAVFGLTALLR
jgi:hypothetical protein